MVTRMSGLPSPSRATSIRNRSESAPSILEHLEEREHVMAEWPAPKSARPTNWNCEVEYRKDWRYWLCCRCLENPAAQNRFPFDAGCNEVFLPALTSLVMRPADRIVAAICSEVEPAPQSVEQSTVIGCSSQDPSEEKCRSENASSTSVKGLARKRCVLQSLCLIIGFIIHFIWYYYHLLAANTEVGKPVPFTCASYFDTYAPDDIWQCGLLASQCKPLDSWMHIRCPSFCSHKQHEFENGHLIRKVIGSGPYRADSAICMAAMHAGYLDGLGGCIQARFGGPVTIFSGEKKHGIETLNFDSWYPISLDVQEDVSSSHCGYQLWPLLPAFSIIFLFLFALLRPPKQLFFWPFLVIAYWECALVSRGNNQDIESMSVYMGGFFTYIPFCYLLLWKIGGAETFFPDTTIGVPFNVLLLELCPCVFTLHMHLLKYILGDYSLNLAGLKSVGGILFFLGLLVIITPVACFIMWRWYISGMLRNFCCISLGVVLALVSTSLFFMSQDWGLHLHHYFLGLVGYLACRGSSRTATVARALCLGVFINGFVIWGERLELSLWAAGEGWAPPIGSIEFGSSGASYVVFSAAEAMPGNRSVLLSWARGNDIVNNCSLPLELWPTNDVFVIQMNHVEVYRGRSRSGVFSLPSGASRFYFRAMVLRAGDTRSAGVSKVLVVDDTTPAVTPYYSNSSNACERAFTYLRNQPASSLARYV